MLKFLTVLIFLVNSSNAYSVFGLLNPGSCIVSGNQLYINGFAVKTLDSDEMGELRDYENALVQYNQKLSAYLQNSSNYQQPYGYPPYGYTFSQYPSGYYPGYPQNQPNQYPSYSQPYQPYAAQQNYQNGYQNQQNSPYQSRVYDQQQGPSQQFQNQPYNQQYQTSTPINQQEVQDQNPSLDDIPSQTPNYFNPPDNGYYTSTPSSSFAKNPQFDQNGQQSGPNQSQYSYGSTQGPQSPYYGQGQQTYGQNQGPYQPQNQSSVYRQYEQQLQQTQGLPQRPPRPSFCGERVATQYFFDGCSVQNDRVYVDTTYVRTLTPDEIQQLGEFDQALSRYQDELDARTKQQMGQILQAYYQINVPDQTLAQNDVNPQQQNSNPSNPSGPQPLDLPQAPRPPQVCTVIY